MIHIPGVAGEADGLPDRAGEVPRLQSDVQAHPLQAQQHTPRHRGVHRNLHNKCADRWMCSFKEIMKERPTN